MGMTAGRGDLSWLVAWGARVLGRLRAAPGEVGISIAGGGGGGGDGRVGGGWVGGL